jgi:hypothetical protein
VYAEAINKVRVNDGWVDISQQANRTAPSGYRSRYPQHDFRVVPNTAKGSKSKPYVLQARRLRKPEREARDVERTQRALERLDRERAALSVN